MCRRVVASLAAVLVVVLLSACTLWREVVDAPQLMPLPDEQLGWIGHGLQGQIGDVHVGLAGVQLKVFTDEQGRKRRGLSARLALTPPMEEGQGFVVRAGDEISLGDYRIRVLELNYQANSAKSWVRLGVRREP